MIIRVLWTLRVTDYKPTRTPLENPHEAPTGATGSRSLSLNPKPKPLDPEPLNQGEGGIGAL